MQHATIAEATFRGDTSSRSAAKSRGRPIHQILVTFSAAYFAGALVTDLAYWHVPDVLWERFSIWLIAAGLVMAALATIAYLIDLAGGRRIDNPAWSCVIGYALAVLLSVINAFVHSRDGYTAVVPTGLMLSGLAVVILLLVGWLGSRDRTGAAI
jgi:uncharacterized membrane protein